MKWLFLVLATWPIEAPPPQYDHPFHGKVIVSYDAPGACGSVYGGHASGCAYVSKGVCRIHLRPKGSTYGFFVMDNEGIANVFRHERAHCNGWRHHGDRG